MGKIGQEPYDRLKGYQVIARFNIETKREKKIPITKTHRGHGSTFEGNVECILDLPIKRKIVKL